MKKMKLTNGILILMLLAGLSLLLYPTISDYYNSFHQSQAIVGYNETVLQLDAEDYSEIWDAAVAYNESLITRNSGYMLKNEQKEQYEQLLDINDSGIMGYVKIPSIDVNLPIYHGTDEAVLQVAIGHIEWSSLPVGGANTHCVISGHRGLPSAKLFTNLDRMEIGDTFMLQVLDEILTYEVDQILVVEPQEVQELKIIEGQDLVTLVTCTPYGVNSHRLLVRGHRVDNAPVVVERHVTADAVVTDPMIVAAVLAIPCVIIGIIAMFAIDGISGAVRKKKKKGGAA